MPKTKPTLGMKNVWLLTTGDGEDGNEWYVQSIHKTCDGAVSAKEIYERLRHNPNGSTYRYEAQIEKWNVER